ncbi:MAG: Gfo/Idh/MocA family oxidoreductase [Thermoguttaceae bacterium]
MPKTTRRTFLKTTTVASAGYLAAAGSQRVWSQSPNEKLGVACIGIGGKGGGDSNNAAQYGRIVAICDTDRARLADKKKGEKFKNAETYTDYRKMLEENEKNIDIVTVSTPDHMHAAPTLMAMRMKKNVYTQKPLTRSIYECSLMGKVAEEMGVCTQMGNQGASLDSSRHAIGELKAGAIGKAKEVFVWTNRPVWPQGVRGDGSSPVRSIKMYEEEVKKEAPDEVAKLVEQKQKEIEKALEGLDWKSWLGTAPERVFYPSVYHDFKWRGWWDFGGGALADMGCHMTWVPYFGCNLGYATATQAKTSGHNFDIFPDSSIVKMEFPKNESHDGVTYWWYDKLGNKPDIDLAKYKFRKGNDIITKLSDTGVLIVGTDGAFLSPDDYCGERYYSEGVKVPENVEIVNPDITGIGGGNNDQTHMHELFLAVEKNNKMICTSTFSKAVPLTEQILLGNLAVYAASKGGTDGKIGEWGERIEWDPKTLAITNAASLKTKGIAKMVKPEYTSGYKLD